MVKSVVKAFEAENTNPENLTFPPVSARMLAFSKISTPTDCTLPKHPRYQLRHTPKYSTHTVYHIRPKMSRLHFFKVS